MIRLAAANGSGDLGMADPEDTWPQPEYNPGRPKHLHALGVMAINYRAFQRSMDDLYKFHLQMQKIPLAIINAYYFSLSEEKRISVLKDVFEEYEKDEKVKQRVANLAEYFYWCKNCRDELMHAEQYPPLFGGQIDMLYLTKRIGKEKPKTGYFALSLKRLRNIADKTQEGQRQCARVRIYLRVRGRPKQALPISLRGDEFQSLPEILRVPKPLRLSLVPPDGPLGSHLQKSFPQ
jgi:hypothetical protein